MNEQSVIPLPAFVQVIRADGHEVYINTMDATRADIEAEIARTGDHQRQAGLRKLLRQCGDGFRGNLTVGGVDLFVDGDDDGHEPQSRQGDTGAPAHAACSMGDRKQITWLPVLNETGGWLGTMPLSTFGLLTKHEAVPVPEAEGALVDRDLAELVALLNRAGVRTLQSCQDIGNRHDLGPRSAEVVGENEDGDFVRFLMRFHPADLRYGCVVVKWEQFPALSALLPRYVGHGNGGWLLSVQRDISPGHLYVSVLFPWGDLDRFIASVKAGASS
jgi:hypothetical protein